MKVEIDATHLRFDPNDSKFVDSLCNDLPAFKEYYDYAESKPEAERIFAWVVCMYDLYTPLRTEIKDVYKRKVYAGSLVGLVVNKATAKYKQHVEDILIGRDEAVNNLIVIFSNS